MKNQKSFWIFVADRSGGRLLEGSIAKPDRPHLELLESVENNEEVREHGSPSPRRDKLGHSAPDFNNEEQELSRRYAKSLVEWLAARTASRDIAHLTVFAPPSLAGELRGHWTPQLKERIDEKQVDLGGLSAGDLAKHKALADLFGALSA
jgi:protein required for attachment to host cells